MGFILLSFLLIGAGALYWDFTTLRRLSDEDLNNVLVQLEEYTGANQEIKRKFIRDVHKEMARRTEKNEAAREW